MSTPILVRATHEQYLVSVGRQLSEWGQDFTLEQFTRRELLLKSTPFGQTLQCWVLAPSADPTTRDFFCSCETFRRPVLLSSGARKVCYSNAGVFTPIENRRKGYARQMMDELNRAVRVGAGDEGADWGEGEGAWQGGNDAVCSVLYSDVGDYYAKSGWDLVGPIQTTWKLDQLPPSAFTASTSLLPIPYDLATFASIAQADSLLVASSLPPTPASFAIEPLGSSCEWRIEREDFVTFTINYPKSTLKILRIRTTGPDAVIPGFNPDPTVLAVGGDYFICTSTFEFFPGHPIYHSKDLIDWTLIGHALNRPIYTAEVRQQSRSFYVTTTDIFSNDWSEPIFMDVLGYDVDIFFDDDGAAYVTRADIDNNVAKVYGIYQATIDIGTGKLLSEDKLIFNGTLPLNSTARPEGPHIYKIEGIYYLLIAEGGSSVYHRSTIQRGPSPSGPWENFAGNPLIYNGVDPDPNTQPVQFTGHADIMQAQDGSWWGVCLGIRPQGGELARAQLGRETFLYPVTWQDGWPIFNDKQSIGLDGPGIYNLSSKSTSYFDDFSSDILDIGYYYLRTPYLRFWSLLDRPGWLRLQGGPFTLGDREQPSLLLRKQTALHQLWETVLDFNPNSTKQEAGIVVFYSDFYYQSIGVTLCPAPALGNSSYSTTNISVPLYDTNPLGDAACIVHRQIIGNNATAESPIVLANATVTTLSYFPIDGSTDQIKLAIQGEDVRYSFGWAPNPSTNITWVGAVDSIWLASAPIGYGWFKGVQFGLYSQGGERNMFNNPADFKYIKQETLS
ncbi:hypothetical protein RQP46_005248 [Phenoliferia psychrophenolica]